MSNYDYPGILCIEPVIGPITEINDCSFNTVIKSTSIYGDDIKLFLYFIQSGKNKIGNFIRKRCSCCFEINLEFDEFNSATICETVRAHFKEIFNYEFLPEVYNNIERSILDNNYIPKRALMQ